jgi:hypothetical protein
MTATFLNERAAQEFAKARLADSAKIAAGTLNPHVPKLTINSKQVLEWLGEPND